MNVRLKKNQHTILKNKNETISPNFIIITIIKAKLLDIKYI